MAGGFMQRIAVLHRSFGIWGYAIQSSGLFYVVDSLNQSFNVKRRKPVTVNSLSLAAR